jgi:hypothetical protein
MLLLEKAPSVPNLLAHGSLGANMGCPGQELLLHAGPRAFAERSPKIVVNLPPAVQDLIFKTLRFPLFGKEL